MAKKPRPPQPYNLYMIVKRAGHIEIKPVHAHSEIQAVTHYCHKIKKPWLETDYIAELIEEPARRQPKSYRDRLAKYEAKLAAYIRKHS